VEQPFSSVSEGQKPSFLFALTFPALKSAQSDAKVFCASWERLRAGALPGLQILCTAQKAVGGFNSHPLPPNKAFSALSNPVKFASLLSAQDF
jgi:hypothetical protein